ncbi:MAG TPA: hypothetical protein VEL31_06905 [Ktedonobacteraceae bacterium]|nr:hypothetical protein [Ktedonobacteraceae bacterium]
MENTTTFLLHVLEENWLHARLSEEKRARLANLALVITLVVQALLVLMGFSPRILPLTLLLIVLGFYAFVVSLKLYERAQFHTLRARKVRAHLNELCLNAQVEELLSSAEQEHSNRYPFWQHTRLNTLWLGLHLLIVIIGVVETIFCLR